MPVADDDYRKKLAERQRKMNATKREAAFAKSKDIPEMVEPNTGIIPIGPLDDFARGVAEKTNRGRLAAMTSPSKRLSYNDSGIEFMPGVAGVGSVAGMGAGGGGRLLDKLATPILQRAVQTAQAEGRQLGGQWLEEGALQGVKFGQSSVTRAGRGAEDELFNFISELERLGVKPQTANKFLKGFSEYVDDPFQGMSTLGENMSRTTPGFKEGLVMRLLGRLEKAAEDSFLG
jgi:hypothetical protein